MKAILGFIVLFSLLITFPSIGQDVFADTYTVKPASGSGSPGCEESSSGCFLPNILTISKGDSVRFINTDSAAHTFTSGDSTNADSVGLLFDSSLVMANYDYSVKLTESGTVPYFCIVHPWMAGIIIVNDSGSSLTDTPPPPTNTPPTSSGTDWQGKYLKILSDFNEVSAKVGELQKENNDLKQQVKDLEKTVEDLNAIIMEQVKVIYDWVVGK